MKPYRYNLGRFVEKYVLPFRFELGVLVVALLLGTFVVATYANASPGYGPPEGWEAWDARQQELGPDVQPCNIDLATGENCQGEKVWGARSDDTEAQDPCPSGDCNVAHPEPEKCFFAFQAGPYAISGETDWPS